MLTVCSARFGPENKLSSRSILRHDLDYIKADVCKQEDTPQCCSVIAFHVSVLPCCTIRVDFVSSPFSDVFHASSLTRRLLIFFSGHEFARNAEHFGTSDFVKRKPSVPSRISLFFPTIFEKMCYAEKPSSRRSEFSRRRFGFKRGARGLWGMQAIPAERPVLGQLGVLPHPIHQDVAHKEMLPKSV